MNKKRIYLEWRILQLIEDRGIVSTLHLGANNTALRAALKRLEEEGLIHSQTKDGTRRKYYYLASNKDWKKYFTAHQGQKERQ